ncbi:IS982 family transposase [Lactobacillus crispatus]|uniref:IS982 family transposase n=1 Tax=Lactobacillus crispatus TaxID=47770 RepID=UPI0015DFD860|nr:IS982 family transposase [Lactobacillus crispatus]QLK32700.1 IS982 family transposase [Lactobacillus crispatus]
MNYLKLKRFSHHLQVSFNRLNVICRSLYKLYAPDGLKHRKNVDQTKLPDSSILAMLIWQTEIGIESQRRFCKFFVGLSHSRFNRRARMLLPLIRCIRQAWNQEVKTAGEFLIIDSFPVPVCQPVRNYRVKIFRGVADIGYKATKKVYYYGFKVHAIVSDDGYLLNYAVTKASVHDAKETVELMAIRRSIESDFSLLSYYNAENNRARSPVGFQQRLEIAILAYNMAYCLERFN